MKIEQDLKTAIQAAATVIENAEALVILAGAGMGVDSGLPDYRGDEGLWRAYPRLKHLGLSFAEMAKYRLIVSATQKAAGHTESLL